MPNYLTPAQASKHLPGRPHVNTVSRWMLKGADGVKLQSIKIGGRRFTTPAWCEQFVTEASGAESNTEHLAASAELAAMGV